MPTHPECLYYLYKGYTHVMHIYFIVICAREIKTHYTHTHTHTNTLPLYIRYILLYGRVILLLYAYIGIAQCVGSWWYILRARLIRLIYPDRFFTVIIIHMGTCLLQTRKRFFLYIIILYVLLKRFLYLLSIKSLNSNSLVSMTLYHRTLSP